MKEIIKQELSKDYSNDKILILSFLYLKMIAAKNKNHFYEREKAFDYKCDTCFNQYKLFVIEYCNLNENSLEDITYDLFQNNIIIDELKYDNLIEIYNDKSVKNYIYISQNGIEYLKKYYNIDNIQKDISKHYNINFSDLPINSNELTVNIIINSIVGNNNKNNKIN